MKKKNTIQSVSFEKSSQNIQQCPTSTMPEIAFIGRSNVGKSSLINAICNRKGLAKTSSTPGKTQLINHFLVNEKWYLVDLPGYGWASVSKTKKAEWEKNITRYLLERESLYCLFVLIDLRLPPQKKDVEFLDWIGENEIPFAIIFTKSDKISNNKIQTQLRMHKQHLLKTWEELPELFTTSSETKFGTIDVLQYIEKILN